MYVPTFNIANTLTQNIKTSPVSEYLSISFISVGIRSTVFLDCRCDVSISTLWGTVSHRLH